MSIPKCEKCGSQHLHWDRIHGRCECKECRHAWPIDASGATLTEVGPERRECQIQARLTKAELLEMDEQRGILYRSQWFVSAVQEKLAKDRLNA